MNDELKQRGRRPSEVGRKKVVEAAQAVFRLKVGREISRQEIARRAGVTPAIVSYYFATNADLVLAVTGPVLIEAVGKLRAAIQAPGMIEARLQRSVELCLDFARENTPLLDLFVGVVIDSGHIEGQELITSCMADLSQLFSDCVDAGLIARNADPRLLLLALWGMCRLIGETPPVPIRAFGPEKERDPRAEAEFVTRLILRGVAPDVRS